MSHSAELMRTSSLMARIGRVRTRRPSVTAGSSHPAKWPPDRRCRWPTDSTLSLPATEAPGPAQHGGPRSCLEGTVMTRPARRTPVAVAHQGRCVPCVARRPRAHQTAQPVRAPRSPRGRDDPRDARRARRGISGLRALVPRAIGHGVGRSVRRVFSTSGGARARTHDIHACLESGALESQCGVHHAGTFACVRQCHCGPATAGLAAHCCEPQRLDPAALGVSPGYLAPAAAHRR
jgi:hypothetical protein